MEITCSFYMWATRCRRIIVFAFIPVEPGGVQHIAKPGSEGPEPQLSFYERKVAFNETTSSIRLDFLNFTCCVLYDI